MEGSGGIQLPVLEYGYRTKPLEWEELVQIIAVEQNFAKLSRNSKQQLEYEIFKRDLNSQWTSIYDFILCNKFGFDSEQGSDNKKMSCAKKKSLFRIKITTRFEKSLF